MKKGMVVYLTTGKEEVPIHDFREVCSIATTPGIAAAYVATSEDEVMYGWFHLVCRGMHQVLYAAATFDASVQRFEMVGEPCRIYG